MHRIFATLTLLGVAVSSSQAQTYAGIDRLEKQTFRGTSFDSATGDIDNDGDMDIVIAKSGSLVRILVNNGRGLFAEAAPVVLSTDAGQIELFDMNNDGHLDIVTSALSLNRIIIARGNAGPTVQSPIRVITPSSPSGLKGADFDGDGLDDLAVALPDSDEVLVYISNGFDFSSVQVVSTVGLGATGDRPERIDVADLNADGFLDVVSTNWTSRDIGVYYGLSNGGFLGGLFGTFIPTTRTPFDVRIAHVDSGTAPDIVYTDAFSGNDGARIGWLRNDYDGGVEPFPDFDDTLFLTSTGGRVVDLEIADIDCDGDNLADVIGADEWIGSKGVEIMTSSGTAPLTRRPRFSLNEVSDRPNSVSAADFDGDGDTDFVVHDLIVFDNFTVYLNRCAGTNCPADVTGDGVLNFFDINTFLGWYTGGDPRADIASPAGTLNFFDVSEYISLYNAGCP